MRHIFCIFQLVVLLLLNNTKVLGQDTAKKTLPVMINAQNDTILLYRADVAVFEEVIDKKALKQQKQWSKLMRDISKVYPLAQAAAQELQNINDEMAKFPEKKDQKKYLDEQEKRLKDVYTSKLEDLTFSQGKLLIKLVDRQTGQTSYSLIKEYRSGFTATFWQGFASVFGMSLKERYDPENEPEIEQMLQFLGYK